MKPAGSGINDRTSFHTGYVWDAAGGWNNVKPAVIDDGCCYAFHSCVSIQIFLKPAIQTESGCGIVPWAGEQQCHMGAVCPYVKERSVHYRISQFFRKCISDVISCFFCKFFLIHNVFHFCFPFLSKIYRNAPVPVGHFYVNRPESGAVIEYERKFFISVFCF